LFGGKPRRSSTPSSTEGRLVYAIGDIHGRNDLLLRLLSRIEDDRKITDGAARPLLVFLGDYIDRGPDSRAVIDTILSFSAETDMEVQPLKGNHEHQMLLFLEDASAGPPWGAYGGRETLMSYGVRPPTPQAAPELWEEARAALADATPADHLAFLKSLALTATCGDYLFVHAGVRPGVPLDENTDDDLMTIRDDFLSSKQLLEKVVVHGHTPQAEPHLDGRRIGIDTGAFATGRLTAVRLYDQARTILQVEA
jgi:serine/threonine protein phosphatase 1